MDGSSVFGNPPDSMLDFDFMDELLLDGCWLQATDGSEFINNTQTQTFSNLNSNPNPNPLFDPSFLWPALDFSHNENPQEESQRSTVLEKKPNPSKSLVKNSSLSENFPLETPEMSRKWWIPPRAIHGPSLSVTERLIYAIENIKHYTIDKNLLVQVWLPDRRAGRNVLSTSPRLFSLDPNCPRLSNYRNISEKFGFPAEGKEVVGLPGRVFMGRVPEWTPDVRFFRTEEYPRVDHARNYDIRGSVAVPILDQDSRSCLGVIEVVMTTRKSNYSTEIQRVCQALEAVDLRSCESSNRQRFEVTSDGSHQVALPEILEILTSACKTYNLPLAQTWIPCIQQGKGGCRHSNENLMDCISTVDSASYVHDPRFKDFQEACSVHHLLKGQGVVGRAFTTNQPCYSPDVTTYTKTEYPLSHHAQIFNLHGVVAIRLRSTLTATVDYVLEFFLPVECRDLEDQARMLNSLSVVIENLCQSLRIVTEKELAEEEDVMKVEQTGYSGGRSRDVLVDKSVVFVENGQNESGGGDGGVVNEGHKKVERRRGGAKTEKTITLETLRQYFAGSLKDAAKNIGVCPTTLKRICRQHGIQRWPSRKIKKVGHSLQKIQLVMDAVHGASGTFQLDSFYSNFSKLTPPDPSKPINPNPQALEAATTLSPSCSQTSSSGQSCSSGTHPYPHRDDALKRTRSDAALLVSNDQEPPKLLQRSHSQKLLQELPNLPPKPQKVNSRDVSLPRVKVTYGEEKVRFRLQKHWGYGDLLQEIAKRFGVNDMGEFHLKYFDDDDEWVLLTCDADLEECVDVYRSCNSTTIRLALLEPQHHVGSSLGSNVPL